MDSKDAQLAMANQKDGSTWAIPVKNADGWSCLSPRDVQKFLTACKKYGVDLIYCVLDGPSGMTGCSDGSIRRLSEIENWSCVSPRDREVLLNFCKGKP